jgi:hypothetical protein
MTNPDKLLKTLLVSLIWTVNGALISINEFSFEKAWLVALLSGILVFSILALIEDDEWHDLITIILGGTGGGFMLVLLCFIVLVVLWG